MVQVNINTLRITNVDTGSAVAIGTSYFCDWRTSSKSNSGFGRVNGDHGSLADLALQVDDPDLEDLPVPE